MTATYLDAKHIRIPEIDVICLLEIFRHSYLAAFSQRESRIGRRSFGKFPDDSGLWVSTTSGIRQDTNSAEEALQAKSLAVRETTFECETPGVP